MAIDIQASTDEQIQKEQTRQAELHKSVTDTLKGDKIQQDILKDLGVSPEAEPKPRKKQEDPQEEEQYEESQEESEEENTQDNQDTDENQENEEETEEVIPKSKVQKRFDELTAKNKALERKLEELENSRQTPKDEITKQLESMSQEELKKAKLEVRKLQIKAQGDDAKIDELLALEDKIDSVIQEAPKNFRKAQENAYIKKAQEIAELNDIPNLEKVAPQITKIANDIYNQYPALQKDINGQATALELAVNHFKAINSASGDKSKETELKRQNNNLKKKVTLDTKGSKVNADKSKMDSLRKNAIGGTMRQKVDLVRLHPMFNVDKMIPDEFK